MRKYILKIFLALLFMTIGIKAQSQGIENQGDRIYNALEQQLSLTKINQEQTTIKNLVTTVYGTELSSSYNTNSIKSELAVFESKYSNVENASPWFNKNNDVIGRCYNLNSFDQFTGLLVIYYFPSRDLMIINYLKYNNNPKDVYRATASLCK